MTSAPSVAPQQLPRAMRVLAVAVGAIVLALAARQLGWLLAPIALAAVLVILVHPVRAWLVRHRVPRLVASLALVLGVFALVLAVFAMIALAVARLATVLPTYVAEWDGEMSGLAAGLADLGIGPDQIETLLGGLDLRSFTGWLTQLLPSVLGAASSIVFFISMLFFMTVESTHAGMRFARLAADHPRVGEALTAFVSQTRRFYAITGAFAVVVGVLDTVFLLAIGVPLALLWGVLAAVCNFIPYIGFVIGMVPPALLALLTGGWQQMLLVVVVYFVLNSLVTTLLPAKVVGDAVGLSMVVTVLSVGFWAWVLGPLGAVLAVPMTLLIKAVFVDADPRAAWLSSILTSQRELAQAEPSRSAA